MSTKVARKSHIRRHFQTGNWCLLCGNASYFFKATFKILFYMLEISNPGYYRKEILQLVLVQQQNLIRNRLLCKSNAFTKSNISSNALLYFHFQNYWQYLCQCFIWLCCVGRLIELWSEFIRLWSQHTLGGGGRSFYEQ